MVENIDEITAAEKNKMNVVHVIQAVLSSIDMEED